MKTRKTIFLAFGLFLVAASMSAQLLSTIPSNSQWLASYKILVQVKKAEDKNELIEISRQNKHRLKEANHLTETFFEVEIPHSTQIETAIDQYKNLSFVESATYVDPILLPTYESLLDIDHRTDPLYLNATR